jgi:hypothetical protein
MVDLSKYLRIIDGPEYNRPETAASARSDRSPSASFCLASKRCCTFAREPLRRVDEAVLAIRSIRGFECPVRSRRRSFAPHQSNRLDQGA